MANNALQEWKDAALDDRRSAAPKNYCSTESLPNIIDAPEGWECSFERLGALRRLALCAQHPFPDDEEKRKEQRRHAYDWISFLISDESTKRCFYLQEHRAADDAFYRDGRPKPRGDWDVAWQDKLKRLSPERLTIAELELALALFVWNAEGPALVWWAKEHPYILWRVHHFLFERYCFPLLWKLRKAMKAGKKPGATAGNLYQPQYRAGEGAHLFPRVGALTLGGTIVVLHTRAIYEFVWHAAVPAAIGAGLLSLLILAALIGLDVFRQNRGLLHGWADAFFGRIAPLMLCTLLWCLVCLALLQGMWGGLEWGLAHLTGAGSAAVRAVIPRADLLPLIGRTMLLTLTGSVLGWVIDWIFGGEAATKPI